MCPVCGGVRGGSYDSCYKCNGRGVIDDGNDDIKKTSSDSSSSSSSTSKSYFNPSAGSALAKEKIALMENYCNKGIELYEQKNYDGAIAEFNKALSYSIVHADSYGWRGRSYIEKKDYDKAIEDLTIAISTLLPDADKKFEQYIITSLDWIPLFYFWRFIAYKGMDNNKKTYADLKMAADWDRYLQAKGKEAGQHYEDDQSGALKYLKRYKIDYTPKMPQIPKEWEHSIPKASSFSNISTASITDTENTSTSTEEYFKLVLKFNESKEYDKVIENTNKIIELKGEYVADAYYFRAFARVGFKQYEEAISDFKLAADYGSENAVKALAKFNIAYTPQKR